MTFPHPLRALAPLALAFALVPSVAPAQTSTFPLASPPVATNAASSAIFDAMLAISRATLTNPAAAQAASFPYAAAIQSYRNGDLLTAQQNALRATAQAAPLPLPQPSAWNAPSLTMPRAVPLPTIMNPAQADAEAFLALSRRSLGTCGAPAAQQTQLEAHYDAAVRENLAHNYQAVRRDAQAIIDGCATPVKAPAAP